MEASSDSDSPFPERRRLGNRPMSPSPQSQSTQPYPLSASKQTSPPLRRHRLRQHTLEEDKEKDEVIEKLKPRLPKPKPRNMTPTKTPSAPPIDDPEDDVNSKPPLPLPKPKHRRRRLRKNPDKSEEITTVSIEDEQSSRQGKESTDLMEMRDILHTFQDDVIRVKSSQRNKWQQKLDEIQSQLLFPGFGEHIKCETASGGDGGGSGSVPSRWRSAAQLIPRDKPLVSMTNHRQPQKAECSFLNSFYILHRMSCYCSGLVAGLFLWQVIFAVSQMMSGSSFTLNSFFWIFYWSLTSFLLLITVCGFVMRINMDDDESLFFNSLLLHFLPCIVIYVTYYVSKGLDLQRQECARYLEVDSEHLKHVHLTYTCSLSEVEKTWESQNYWKISLSILPAIGIVTIYTILHFCPERMKPIWDPESLEHLRMGRQHLRHRGSEIT